MKCVRLTQCLPPPARALAAGYTYYVLRKGVIPPSGTTATPTPAPTMDMSGMDMSGKRHLSAMDMDMDMDMSSMAAPAAVAPPGSKLYMKPFMQMFNCTTRANTLGRARSFPEDPHGGQGESLVPPYTRGSVSLSLKPRR